MQCAEFDQRVNALLDARRGTDDPVLHQHADQCPACAAALAGYWALEHAIDRLQGECPDRPIGALAVNAVASETHVARRLIRAAAVAAALAIVVMLPVSLSRKAQVAPKSATSAHRPQTIASSTAISPADAFRAAGQSWWARMCESAQPLTTAPELLPRPEFQGLSEALQYEPSPLNVLCWSDLDLPFRETTSGAMRWLQALPRIPIPRRSPIESSS